MRRGLICPKSKNVARVELVQFVPTQQFTGVFSCSEFEEPNRVRCTKDFVGEGKLPLLTRTESGKSPPCSNR